MHWYEQSLQWAYIIQFCPFVTQLSHSGIFCLPWVPIKTLFHEKVPYLVPIQGRRSQLDLATVRYHALGAYAKSVYLVFYITIMVRFFTRIVIIPAHLKTLKGGSASAIPWSLSLSKSKFKISISIPDNPQGEFCQCHSPGAFCQGRVPSPHQSWGRNRIRTNSNFQCIKAGLHIKVVADVHSTVMDLFISSFYFAPLGTNALWWYLKMLVKYLMYSFAHVVIIW